MSMDLAALVPIPEPSGMWGSPVLPISLLCGPSFPPSTELGVLSEVQPCIALSQGGALAGLLAPPNI